MCLKTCHVSFIPLHIQKNLFGTPNASTVGYYTTSCLKKFNEFHDTEKENKIVQKYRKRHPFH